SRKAGCAFRRAIRGRRCAEGTRRGNTHHHQVSQTWPQESEERRNSASLGTNRSQGDRRRDLQRLLVHGGLGGRARRLDFRILVQGSQAQGAELPRETTLTDVSGRDARGRPHDVIPTCAPCDLATTTQPCLIAFYSAAARFSRGAA